MGYSKNTYLGPYLKVKNKTKIIIVEKKVNIDGKEFDKDVNFDPLTGEKLNIVFEKKEESEVSSPYIDDKASGLYEDEFMFGYNDYHSDRKFTYFMLNDNRFSIEDAEETVLDELDVKAE